MSAVTHNVLSLAEEDLRSAKYRPRSWGLDGRKSRVYQVFCTIGCPGLQKVPFFKWQKMGLRVPKSKNGRQNLTRHPSQCTMCQAQLKMGNRNIHQNEYLTPHFLRTQLFQIRIFGDCPLLGFTFDTYLGTSWTQPTAKANLQTNQLQFKPAAGRLCLNLWGRVEWCTYKINLWWFS